MKARIRKTGEIVEVYHEPQHGTPKMIYKESVLVNARMWTEDELELLNKNNDEVAAYDDIEAIKAIEDHAYFAGSEAMREKMTNKACEWFYEQLNNGKMECGNIMEFIERFKKAMNL